MSRLASGGLVDRDVTLSFTFDGRRYDGFQGDTLASALLANDVRLTGRSFKYHRPRGIVGAGSEEPSALVTLGRGARTEPNSRATCAELFDGLEARSQNRWPSLRFDALAVNQLFAPLLGAGFYYKTFMWPRAFWERVYEPMIRRAAGLGALSGEADPDLYDRDHAFCDVLVIGAGPAGLIAALTVARTGLRTILVDEDHRVGGRLLSERHAIDGRPGADWATAVRAELEAMPNVRILSRTTIVGIYDDRVHAAVERISDHLAAPAAGQPRQRFWRIVAKRTLLATGAIERPLVFGGNDRPGVMLASAVSTYVNRYAVAPGQNVAIFTTSDSGWATALDLHTAGVGIAAVVDARADAPPVALAALQNAGVPIHCNAVVRDVHGGLARAVSIRGADGRIQRVAADCVAMAGGWSATIGLGSNLGQRPVWSDSIHGFVLGEAPTGMIPIGAAAGAFSLAACLGSGEHAARLVVGDLGRIASASPTPEAEDEPTAVSPLWLVKGHRGKAFVDFQHDVTAADVSLAAREGFVSVEHMKRYTTLGMATDQGKLGQLAGNALLADATGRAVQDVGTILSRPPWLPVAIGALAGPHRDTHFRPERRTAGHDWAVAQGAAFVDAGQWKRPQWFARAGERDWLQTVDREVRATREGVGICDVSTLGKIEVCGPDAGTLLDRLYINMISTLAVGKARYGVMLREDGLVFDDGTVTRFAEDRYFVTTTTANAANVMRHIDFARQALWPDLDVQATSVTEQWSTYSVAGPRARELVAAAVPGIDLANDAFPFMAAAEVPWHGVTVRLFRVSFSGELAYEIAVPATRGDALIRRLFELGATPYGTEALGVMRIEKGHAAGNELNGTTTAADLGMGRMMSKKKDFIGRVMAGRPGLTNPDRPALVGIRPLDPADRIRGGGHLLPQGGPANAAAAQGYVTSAAHSPTLDSWIALALVKRGRERHGERLRVHDPVRGADVQVELCDPVFIDPEGVRVRG